MKFKPGDEVWYVCPYIFLIEKVKIDFIHDDMYADETYALYYEDDLFFNLEEAKEEALNRLRLFYLKQEQAIKNTGRQI